MGVTSVSADPIAYAPANLTAAQFQAFLDRHATDKRPVVARGAFSFSTRINVPDNLTLICYDGASFTTTDSNLNNPVFYLHGCSSVYLAGFSIDGNKSAFGVTENKHGISIDGNVSNVTIQDVTLCNCKGDGLYFGSASGTAHNTDVTCRNVTCDANHRNGCSITELQRGRFSDCVFSNTSGTSPLTGLDIEPNNNDDLIDDLRFTDCAFLGNAGNGGSINLKASPSAAQRNIRFTTCTFQGNTINGFQVYNAADVSFIDCDFRLNTEIGIHLYQTAAADIRIIGGNVEGNGQYGIGATGNADATIDRLRIIGVTVKDNSTASAGAYEGIRLTNLVTDAIISGCSVTGSDQPYGVRIGAPPVRVRLIGNDLTGNGTAGAIFNVGMSGHIVEHNHGFITRARGTGSIASGATNSGEISHGLASTVTRVTVSSTNNPTNDPGHLWVSNKGTTTFIVNCRSDPGVSTLTFDWIAEAVA